MFYGGLNGDGFFNEEYEGDDCDGCGGGYRSPIKLEDLGLAKTSIETDKAIQLQWKEIGTIWLPKEAMTKPNFNSIEPWATKIVKQNIKNLVSNLKAV